MKQRAFGSVRPFLSVVLALVLPAATPVAAETQAAGKRLVLLDEAIVSALHNNEGLKRAEVAIAAAKREQEQARGQRRFFWDAAKQLSYELAQVEHEQVYSQAVADYREAAYKLAFQVKLAYWQAYWTGTVAAQKHAVQQAAQLSAKEALTKQLYGFSDESVTQAAREAAKLAADEAAAADQAYADAVLQLMQQVQLAPGTPIELTWREEWINSEESLTSPGGESEKARGKTRSVFHPHTSRMAEQKLAAASMLFFHPAIFFTNGQAAVAKQFAALLPLVQQEKQQEETARAQAIAQTAQAKAKVEKAKAAYETVKGGWEAAQRTVSRAESLYMAGSLSRQELDRLKEAEGAARKQMAAAEYAYRLALVQNSEWTATKLQVVEAQVSALAGDDFEGNGEGHS